MRKTQIITILLLFISLTTYSQSDYRKLADSLKYVYAVPYIESLADA
ncbi:hypothetical protein [Dysgonomonas sp. ZJ279]|nr:hypothetical protein [Dysgonomonas sp. ZJ279]